MCFLGMIEQKIRSEYHKKKDYASIWFKKNKLHLDKNKLF